MQKVNIEEAARTIFKNPFYNNFKIYIDINNDIIILQNNIIMDDLRTEEYIKLNNIQDVDTVEDLIDLLFNEFMKLLKFYGIEPPHHTNKIYI